MTNIPQLPGAHAWKDGQGRPLPVEFYKFFRDLALRQDIPADVSAQVSNLLVRVEALEAESDALIHPDSPITVTGTLAGGLVVVGLEDKTPTAGGTLQKTAFDAKGLRTEEDAATTDDLPEGIANLYFTDERAQDAVGNILTDSAEIYFTYDDITPSISASIVAGSIDETKLDASVNASLALADSSLQPGDSVDWTWLDNVPANITAWAAIPPSSKEDAIAGGTTGQFWRGDKVFSDEIEGYFKVNQDSAPSGQPGIEVTADASLGAFEHANITATTYGLNGGGTFHGRFARGTRSSPSQVLANDIYAGIGGRPYHSGGDFYGSSPVSIHWVAKENLSLAGAGGCLRVLTTAVGQPQSNRKIALVVADDGDLVVGSVDNNPSATLAGRGLVVVREGGSCEQAQYSYGAGPNVAAGVRLMAAAGTVSSPGATVANSSVFFGMGGHDGSAYKVASAAGIFIQATANWSTTSTPCRITFSTTASGSTDRQDRWRVTESGMFEPVLDNTYDAGSASAAIRNVFAAHVNVNTTAAPGIDVNRTNTTVNALIGATTTSGSIYFGQGQANTFTVGPTNSLNPQANQWFVVSSNTVAAGPDNVSSSGSPSRRWTQVYATSGTINTSDAREKTAVTPLSENEMACASALAKEIGWYKWLHAIEEKGEEAARKHVGMTVQRVIEVMRAYDMDPFEWGFVCYDQWPETIEPAVYEDVIDENGAPTGERTLMREAVTHPAGDRYSLRDGELLKFIARGQEQRLAAIEAHLGL